MSYLTEFPDFDHAIDAAHLTALGFEDTSWRNDVSPSFTRDDLVIWVNYADPAAREFAESSAFEITLDGRSVLTSDAWADVRAFLA